MTREHRFIFGSLLTAVLFLAGCATPTPSPSGATAAPSPQTRDFHLVTSVQDFDEDAIGIPHDTFTPDTLVVMQGDKVVIHFHNVEKDEEDHSFTMTGTYARDVVLHAGGEENMTFTATEAGVFPFYCKFHEPTMSGQFVVLKT